VQQSNWHDYWLATRGHMPSQVSVHIVPSADLPTDVGEPEVPPLANTFAALTGKPLRSLPFA